MWLRVDLIISTFWTRTHLLGSSGIKGISQMTLSTVLAILVLSHKDTGTTSLSRAFTTQAGNFASAINLVKLENAQLDLLSLVLDLLGSGVDLLLSLLTTSTQTQDQMQSGFFLDVVVREGSAVLQLLSSKDKTLLIWRNSYKHKRDDE